MIEFVLVAKRTKGVPYSTIEVVSDESVLAVLVLNDEELEGLKKILKATIKDGTYSRLPTRAKARK